MRSEIDKEISLRDRMLPGLALILDTDAMAQALGGPAMRVDYLRYKPGTSCTASVAPRGRPADLHSLVAVMAYPPDRYAEVRARREWDSKVRFLDGACVAVVPPALDRDLNLRKLAAPDGKLLRRYGLPQGGRAMVLRYKPGRRLVLRLEDAQGCATALLKIYHRDAFASALSGAEHAAELGHAQILHVDEERKTIATTWISGSPLCPSAGASAAGSWFATGQTLARLHQSSHDAERKITAEHDLLQLKQHLRGFSALLPDAAPRSAPLVRGLGEALTAASPAPCLVHGDFSADQVIMAGSDAHILDWDRSGRGDPGRDIGSFLACLDVQLIDGSLDSAAHLASVDSFLAGYRQSGGTIPDTAHAHHLRALLLLLGEGFRLRLDDWPGRDAKILARAESLEARLRLGDARSEEILMKSAFDPVDMAHQLGRACVEAPGACPQITLVRHKLGRRALVHYTVDGPNEQKAELLGKIRFKGMDARTSRLHDALRAAGLDGTGAHGVGIPPSRGDLPELNMWLQDMVPGSPVADSLVPGGETTYARLAGAALAHLHSIPPLTDRVWTLHDEVGVLERALSSAQTHLPDHAIEISRILVDLKQAACALGPAPLVGLHRDFYQDQVLIHGTRSWIIDLDLYACGDAAIDVGNFVAHLDEFGVRDYGSADALCAHADAFVEGYMGVRPQLDIARIALLRRLSLTRHIAISRKILGRAHTTLPLIEICGSQTLSDD